MINLLDWSSLVFKRAQVEDKPICVFVMQDGYWSRVLIKRIFRDNRVISLLEQSYITVRVNAEEYPEVSNFTLKFLKISTGQAGYPLVMWFTPKGIPIMGMTSLSLDDRPPQSFGLITHLKLIARYWRDPAWNETNQLALEEIRHLSEFKSTRRADQLSYEEYMIDYAERWILKVDPIWGGFTSPQKFPLPLVLSGILGVWNELGYAQHLHVVEYSLVQLLKGGVYDHIGGGIWRYSMDEKWSSGCYEKLLIDQAHFTLLLTQLYRITKRRIYRDALRATAELIYRDFVSADGGLITRIGLEDHDESMISRGAFHQASWSNDEIYSTLEIQDAEWFIKSFLSPEALSRRESNHSSHRYVPRITYHLNEQEAKYWERLRPKLLQSRRSRDPLDRSLWRITVDNAIASVALARAAFILDEPAWFRTSRTTIKWIHDELWDGLHLYRGYHDKSRLSTQGCLEDYMSVTWALSEFSAYTGDQSQAQLAEVIFDTAFTRFKDVNRGGFFHVALDRRRLLPIEEKPTLDGVDLSGNAWAILALKRLSELTSSPFHRTELIELAERFFESISCQTSSVVSVVGGLFSKREI